MFEVSTTYTEPKTIKINGMKPYQIGKVVGGSYNGCLVMRTASIEKFEVMLLNGGIGPDYCFTNREADVEVHLLPKGTVVELAITE